MKLELSTKKITEQKADCEIVLVVENCLEHKWIKDKKELEKFSFNGKEEQACYIPQNDRFYIGIPSLDYDEIRLACANALKAIGEKNYKSAKIGTYIHNCGVFTLQAMSEGFLLGDYKFEKYKSKKSEQKLEKIIICLDDYSDKELSEEHAIKYLNNSIILANATNLAKETVNNTPDDITPKKFAKLAKDIAKNIENLSCEVFDEKFLKAEKMGAFLAVSRASNKAPRLIHLKYRPKNATKKIVLVGKGLTYDSGGLSLKPSNHMVTMKSDKSGAASVLGILMGAAQMELPFEIDGIIGACENMLGGNAYKNDDVLVARNGKTIEVRNTDAEGRLVLADVLSYAQDQKPDYLIDYATLTGACVVALGEYTSGIMGHDDKLKDSLSKAAVRSGELTGILPFNKYLKKLLKSGVADMANISSSSYGGAITAGLFLDNFIEDEYKDKWLHIDIAGPAYNEKAWGYNQFGATGAGVRMTLYWLRALANQKYEDK